MTSDDSAPMLIRDLPEDDRPRERLVAKGAGSLGNAELLAILLRVGGRGESAVHMAERILNAVGGPAGLLRTPISEMVALKGIGTAKAAQIKAAVELGYRVARAELGKRPTIASPEDAANLLMVHMAGLEQEVVKVLLLNTKNQVLDMVDIYQGSLNASMVRVGELFREAVRQNAAAIIMAHNHPSGDPTPSADDVAVTREVVSAGKLLDIKVLDHLVIAQGRWVSLKGKGLGF